MRSGKTQIYGRGLLWKCFLELLDIASHRAQRLPYNRRRGVHFDARLHRPFRLRIQILDPAIPELSDIEDDVEDRLGPARAFLPAMTDQCGPGINAAGAEVTGKRYD